MTASQLRVAVLLGSVRVGAPHPVRLGTRVTTNVIDQLQARGHEVHLVDPATLKDEELKQPHFTFPRGKAPQALNDLHRVFQDADAYVVVSPEYNHTMSPAVSSTLNLFGSSTFGFKPSAIATYSAGQWGGTRAAMALRPFLGELGCLPVSAMIHVPQANQFFTAQGQVKNAQDQDKWNKYCDRTWSQLEWWAQAAKRQKQEVDPFRASPPFVRHPSERNAPAGRGRG